MSRKGCLSCALDNTNLCAFFAIDMCSCLKGSSFFLALDVCWSMRDPRRSRSCKQRHQLHPPLWDNNADVHRKPSSDVSPRGHSFFQRDQSFPCVFGKRQGKPQKKTRILYPCRTPKIPAKDGKNYQKNKEILTRGKTRNSKKTRKVRTGFACGAIFLAAELFPRIATPSACYRGPKLQKSPKWLGEGAKGVLDPRSKGLPRVFAPSKLRVSQTCLGADVPSGLVPSTFF